MEAERAICTLQVVGSTNCACVLTEKKRGGAGLNIKKKWREPTLQGFNENKCFFEDTFKCFR